MKKTRLPVTIQYLWKLHDKLDRRILRLHNEKDQVIAYIKKLVEENKKRIEANKPYVKGATDAIHSAE